MAKKIVFCTIPSITLTKDLREWNVLHLCASAYGSHIYNLSWKLVTDFEPRYEVRVKKRLSSPMVYISLQVT